MAQDTQQYLALCEQFKGYYGTQHWLESATESLRLIKVYHPSGALEAELMIRGRFLIATVFWANPVTVVLKRAYNEPFDFHDLDAAIEIPIEYPKRVNYATALWRFIAGNEARGEHSRTRGQYRHEGVTPVKFFRHHPGAQPEVDVTRPGDRHNDSTTTHPAYGVIKLTRVSGMQVLAGSSIKHQYSVELSIHRADRHRSSHEDHFFARDEIIAARMSNDQFARVVASMGMGEGTPCTITDFGEIVAEPPYNNPKTIIQAEVKAKLEEVSAEIGRVTARLQSLALMKTIPKGEYYDVMKDATRVMGAIAAQIPFAHEQFNEGIEKTLTEAKTELEHFAATIGIQPNQVLALPGADVTIPLEGPCDPCERTSPECDECGHDEVEIAEAALDAKVEP